MLFTKNYSPLVFLAKNMACFTPLRDQTCTWVYKAFAKSCNKETYLICPNAAFSRTVSPSSNANDVPWNYCSFKYINIWEMLIQWAHFKDEETKAQRRWTACYGWLVFPSRSSLTGCMLLGNPLFPIWWPMAISLTSITNGPTISFTSITNGPIISLASITNGSELCYLCTFGWHFLVANRDNLQERWQRFEVQSLTKEYWHLLTRVPTPDLGLWVWVNRASGPLWLR